jgi:hypothetical protein
MIRWDEPIEAVHEDGRVVAVVAAAPDIDGDRQTAPTLEGGYDLFCPDGSSWSGGPWRIRNVAQAPETGSTAPIPSEVGPEVTERMIALVRSMAREEAGWVNFDEARAIVALLPEPVDADLLEVRRIVADALPEKLRAGILAGDEDHTVSITAPLACLKRGRALAAGDQ